MILFGQWQNKFALERKGVTDTMSNEKKKAVQVKDSDYAVSRVSAEGRKGFFSVSMVTAGFCICMSGLYTGASMAAGASLPTAIIAGIIGNTILTIYGGLLGYAGAREGVASTMLARHGFGREGSKVIGALLAIVMLGWFSVQVGFFGDTIHAMFPDAGFISSKVAATGWGGLLMLLTAYFGYKGLNILSYFAVPLITIISTIGIVVSINSVGGWDAMLAKQTTSPIGIGACVVLVVGSFAGGATAQADITRYAKTPSIALWSSAAGYLIANMFIIMAGFLTTKATGIGDLPLTMLSLGLGFPALIVLILAQWTTNDNNLYTSSLGLANIINVSKKKITLVSGILAILIGMAGISKYFVSWLSLLGIGVPPVAGIIIADYFILKKRHYNYGPGTHYNNWNIWAFISWGVGCVVGYSLKWGIQPINSIVVAFTLYLAMMKLCGNKGVGLFGKVIEQSSQDS